MKKTKFLLIACFIGANAGYSQAQLTLSGELRPRAEYRHGFKSVADSNQAAAFSVEQRTRFKVDYTTEDYQFFLSVQDIRTWGSTEQLNLSDGFISVHEAWAKARLNAKWALKLGRQEIDYDDARMFGNVDWAQQARSHDAALLQFATEKTKLDLGLAFNQMSTGLIGTDYNISGNYRDMYYLWFNRELSSKVKISLLALTIGKQVNFVDGNGENSKSFNYTATFGTHTKFDLGKFKMDFNGYYEMGSDYSPGRNLSAYLLSLDAKYNFTEQFSAGLGYETQSGTTQTDTTKAYAETNHNFTPWFGTNHKFNGYMDYFYVGNAHGNTGLQDAYAKLDYKKDRWTLGLDVHLFMTGIGVEVLDVVSYQQEYTALMDAGNVTAAADLDPYSFTLPANLGTEIDLSIGTKINKSVAVKMGYSHMLATETLASLKGVTYSSGTDAGRGRVDQINNWVYVMVIFKPTFLEKEKK